MMDRWEYYGGSNNDFMVRKPNGPYVAFEDHERELAEALAYGVIAYHRRIHAPADADAVIVKAACSYHDLCFVGWRHGTILQRFFAPAKLKMTNECQGFVDQHGWWWDRQQAALIAHRAGQIDDVEAHALLVSEALWDRYGEPRNGQPWDPREG